MYKISTLTRIKVVICLPRAAMLLRHGVLLRSLSARHVGHHSVPPQLFFFLEYVCSLASRLVTGDPNKDYLDVFLLLDRQWRACR